MSWNVSLRRAASDDLDQARIWYERNRPGLGDEFFLVIADSLIVLEQAAEQFPIYYREFRRLLTPKFPYKVFFTMRGSDVIVFRILHAARDHVAELDPL